MPTAEFVARTLTDAGHQAMATSGCAEGLAMFQERRPDLVLVNYFLTEGDGLAFLERLGRMAPGAPAVMVTGLGNESIAREALRLGAMDYVIKSRSYFRDLPSVVDEALRRVAERASQDAQAELGRRMAAQAELAGWLDHNFKNILSAVAGSISLIDPGNPAQSDDKRREYIADSLKSLGTAVKLLGDLTSMHAVGAAEEAAPVLIASVVDDAWRILAQKLKAGDEDFSASPASLEAVSLINDCRGLSPQRVVRQDLATVVEALLKNAIEAVAQAPEPRIVVRASLGGEFLSLSVEDNGRGMDERVQRHAFEPLFSTKGKVGVGLSLATVMALVHRNHGQVKITSSAGRGALVELTWRLEQF